MIGKTVMDYYNNLFENSPRLAGSVIEKHRYDEATEFLLNKALNIFTPTNRAQ